MSKIVKYILARMGVSEEVPLMSKDFLVVDSDKRELNLHKVAVGEKRVFRFFPITEIKRTGSIPLGDLFLTPLASVRGMIADELKVFPKKVSNLVGNMLNGSNKLRVQQVKSRLGEKVQNLTGKFGEQSLLPYISSDRYTFRKALLEEIGKESSQVFAEIAKKHLAELVMRVRMETAVDDLPQDDKDGPIALPTGTRFVVRRGNKVVFVVEQPPQTKTLRIMDADGVKGEWYQLSLPYVVFFVTLRGRKSDDMYIFFRKKPLRSLQDELLCAGLPNIYSDFRACFSPSAAKETVAQMAEESIANYWGGRFIKTHDPGNYARQINMENWQEASKKDSLFGLSFNWRKSNLTVSSMLDKIEMTEDDASKRGEKSSKEVLSALNVAVNKIAVTVSQKMKERCYGLVTNWQLDSVALEKIDQEFQQMVAQICESLKVELDRETENILSEEAFQDVCNGVVQNSSMQLSLNAEKIAQTVQEKFLQRVKEGSQ